MFGSGSLTADLLIVGEAPGYHEDRSGIPFWGESGRLLRSYLKDAGFSPNDVFITNTVRCRPPKNRDPYPAEMGQCAGHLDATVELIQPRAILTVGRVASRAITSESLPMHEFRTRSGEFTYGSIPVFTAYHPAYILRNRNAAHLLVADLVAVKEFLESEPEEEEEA